MTTTKRKFGESSKKVLYKRRSVLSSDFNCCGFGKLHSFPKTDSIYEYSLGMGSYRNTKVSFEKEIEKGVKDARDDQYAVLSLVMNTTQLLIYGEFLVKHGFLLQCSFQNPVHGFGTKCYLFILPLVDGVEISSIPFDLDQEKKNIDVFNKQQKSFSV